MMTKSKTLKKALMATAFASGMMIAGAANAQSVITFSPGTPSAQGAIDAAAAIQFGTIFDGTAAQTDRLNFVAANNSLNPAGIGTGDVDRSTWNMFFDQNGAFNETFTFLLLSSELGGNAAANRQFGGDGLDNPADLSPMTETFVSVQVTLSGQLDAGAAGVTALLGAGGDTTVIADNLGVTYNTGSFDFFFHDDFDASNVGTEIGSFELVSGQSDVGNSDNRIELGWDTIADEDNAPEFTDENGNAFNPFENLLQNFTQNVEIFGAEADGDGVAVSIFSRGAVIGFSEFPREVPEPGTLALFGIGLMGIGLAARRRRKQAAAA